MDVLSGLRLHLGVGLSLGMDAIPVWQLGVCSGLWMDVGARRLWWRVVYSSAADQSSQPIPGATRSAAGQRNRKRRTSGPDNQWTFATGVRAERLRWTRRSARHGEQSR